MNYFFNLKGNVDYSIITNENYIIILESSWNENEIEQIIGRGVRYKSHIGFSLFLSPCTWPYLRT